MISSSIETLKNLCYDSMVERLFNSTKCQSWSNVSNKSKKNISQKNAILGF